MQNANAECECRMRMQEIGAVEDGKDMTEQIPLPTAQDAAREAELIARIDRWLAHMTWRPDFARWREGRIWQERQQAERLRLIERYGGALAGRRILDLGSGMGGP